MKLIRWQMISNDDDDDLDSVGLAPSLACGA